MKKIEDWSSNQILAAAIGLGMLGLVMMTTAILVLIYLFRLHS